MTDALEVNGTASSSETTKVRGAYATPVLQRFGVLSQRTARLPTRAGWQMVEQVACGRRDSCGRHSPSVCSVRP